MSLPSGEMSGVRAMRIGSWARAAGASRSAEAARRVPQKRVIRQVPAWKTERAKGRRRRGGAGWREDDSAGPCPHDRYTTTQFTRTLPPCKREASLRRQIADPYRRVGGAGTMNG